ncbi:MAG TPA: hypothetical protein VLI67_10130 [Vicinamibacteria bacterium]|nr:hypothetical protein [Vicinamibacteria bacterium]
MLSLSLLLLLLAAGAAGPTHFDVAASFVPPAKPGAAGAIAVSFAPRDPDVHINEEPAPRLKLDLEQTALVDRQPPPPRSVPTFDPETVRYLDLGKPVRFPVAFAPNAPKGPQTVKVSVVYFYCSQREAWCRRGSADLEVGVTVP